MAENLHLRQRLLARLGKVDSALQNLSHLPKDRVLAIDVSMMEDENTEWLRRLIREAGTEEGAEDGEAFFTRMRAKFDADAENRKRSGTVRGSGTAADIAERIGRLGEGQYRFSIERMPSKRETKEKLDALFAESRDTVEPEFVGKTEEEIQEIIDAWISEARDEARAERVKMLRRIAFAQRLGLFTDDEFYVLVYELILSRFGADY